MTIAFPAQSGTKTFLCVPTCNVAEFTRVPREDRLESNSRRFGNCVISIPQCDRKEPTIVFLESPVIQRYEA